VICLFTARESVHCPVTVVTKQPMNMKLWTGGYSRISDEKLALSLCSHFAWKVDIIHAVIHSSFLGGINNRAKIAFFIAQKMSRFSALCVHTAGWFMGRTQPGRTFRTAVCICTYVQVSAWHVQSDWLSILPPCRTSQDADVSILSARHLQPWWLSIPSHQRGHWRRNLSGFCSWLLCPRGHGQLV